MTVKLIFKMNNFFIIQNIKMHQIIELFFF